MSLTNATPLEVAHAAKIGSRKLAVLPTEARNAALTAVHSALFAAKNEILAANALDLKAARKAAEDGKLSQSLVKRLDLGKAGKYEDMLQGILNVRELEDPINKITMRTLLDDDLILEKKTSPIGVLLIIFEARPEVIANIASLAIKSGNAAILKGGKESTESFKAISTTISTALATTSVPASCLQLVQTHDVIADLLKLDQFIDLVIPRGGNKLVRTIKNSTTIPVLGHADGLCTIYLRADCPVEIAVRVLVDAKTSYPAGCNAVETLLVDEDALTTILPAVATALIEKGVSLRCDSASKSALIQTLAPHAAVLLQDAVPSDYETEFLDLILAIKTIPTPSPSSTPSDLIQVERAISHINTHSSHHTDAILTSSLPASSLFLSAVDSASVYWNTSTRMADGMRYGFGTEVGISTNKIHARGPVGLEGLTIYRWLVRGRGQVSTDYGSHVGGKKWRHERMAVGGQGKVGVWDDEGVARNEEEREVLRKFRKEKEWREMAVEGAQGAWAEMEKAGGV
ncbi:gamma-glutamyl phosphate reductase [Lepidopterella palustris CBS 459.81]|uniref:glutamate-5-semialdehyde dehydrogenase n=1 Tax=Lepidopterella palustris CBS 459.81 TaxID=1314670 RepID=A0A8E2JF65_9PEZI|nr:gamma-glutamyl phosphate reductase [Lepidopterella palustris CBS 459.81]